MIALSKSRLPDFDAYAAAMQARSCEIILTARSQSNWYVEKHKLQKIDLEFGSEGGPSVLAGTSSTGSFTLTALTETPSSGQLFNGQRICAFDLIAIPPAQKFIQASEGPHQWVSCLIRCADLPRFERSALTALGALSQQKRPVILKSPTLGRQVALIADSIKRSTSKQSPGIDELERTLIDAISTAILAAVERSSLTKEFLRVRRARSYDIASGTVTIFHQSGNLRFHAADFCRALGVTERQLRRSFQTFFGIGPSRLARIFHINRIRPILIDRSGQNETIREILSAFEITEPGRFAGEYKAIFGETPSETRRKYLAVSHYERPGLQRVSLPDATS